MQDLFIRELMVKWAEIPSDSYLRDIPAIANLTHLAFSHPVTFFVGENGSGKSTLLEALAVAWGFNPEGGTRNYHFSTHDTHSELHDALRLSRSVRRPGWGYFLRAETFYNVATQEEVYGEQRIGGSRGYHLKSHGESFLAMVQDNFGPNSLYFLDEPEAALSPQRQLTLLAEIYDEARRGSQFFIASHSPILLALPGAELLSFDGGSIHPVRYEETESFRVTSLFLQRRETMLEELLK